MSKIYIVLDLEATCFDRNDNNTPKGFQNEIIEIGAVKCNELGEVLDTFCIFIKPTLFPILSEFCKQLTSIKQEQVDNALDFKWCINEFWNWCFKEIKKDVIFVSWGHYDKKQFLLDCKLHNVDQTWINDNNHISLKHKHAEWNNLKKGLGLGSACRFENINFEGTAHRGIDDAKNVAKIFKKYIHKF